MSAEMLGNRGGELFPFKWLEDIEFVSLTVTYGFVNGKDITSYFGIVSEWGSANLAADMEYIKDGQLSSFFWGKEAEGQMPVLSTQLCFISLEQSHEAHCTHPMFSQDITMSWLGFSLLLVHHNWAGTCYKFSITTLTRKMLSQ